MKAERITAGTKVAVSFTADTWVIIKVWFSASTFMVKIATFAKPKNIIELIIT